MGISEIENRLKTKRAYTLKSIELRLIELVSNPSYKKNPELILERLFEEFGVEIFEDSSLIENLSAALKNLNIEGERLFKGLIPDISVFDKSFLGKLKVNHKKLGELLFRRASLLKRVRGGLFTVGELLDWFNRAAKYKIKVEDILKAVRILEKNRIIPGRRIIGGNVLVIQFLPLELSSDHLFILNLASSKGWVTVEEASMNLNWPLERVTLVLDKLVDYGVARLDSSYAHGKKYYFPAFLSK
ncbi:MAG: EAP30/Vps36 family vacuolar-sorting protein [Candidatus Odinarchaeum yellowstonii]|uniref:EAP30/Vps36 family vacuolar-sorting protein n=1 Tax=Odinarchaeota yellowstonii (strain LCB_4) TaxID=1841599 RepID=A0AAF0D1M8_ODILC|nr:MAG: EAP30/Vps36 family vacuolar-sorting protein [Candidatus Odinarchaeum yellowstonii]